MGVVGEVVRVHAIEAHLALAERVLAAQREVLVEVVGGVDRRDVAALQELRRDVLVRDLIGGRHVLEEGVLQERVEAVELHRPEGIAGHQLGVAAVVEVAE